MVKRKIHDKPAHVDAVDGAVLVDWPDETSILLKPPAAEETSERLLEGAMKARGQAYFAGGDKKD